MSVFQSSETPLWVVERPRNGDVGSAQILAGRFGCFFRRVREADDKELAALSPPRLILTTGLRAGLQALRLRRRLGVPVIHVAGRASSGPLSGWPFDVTVLPSNTPQTASCFPVLGPLSIVSPDLLGRARRLWAQRLEHLPRPRIAILLDHGVTMTPEAAMTRSRRLAALVQAHRGSALLSIGAGVPQEVADAFAAGLSNCFNLVWRHGEPDDDPTLGFMACSDAVVVVAGNPRMLVEAAAADVPVFLDDPGGRGGSGTRLIGRLLQGGYMRELHDDFSPWPRMPLDEAGRVAKLLRRKFGL